jgi:uncharacterized protein YndB with AHSA1/START domain
MSCSESEPSRSEPARTAVVERTMELEAPPQVVWEALPELLGDEGSIEPVPGGAVHVVGGDADGERLGVVREAVPARRLAFDWAPVDGDGAPSEVVIELEPRDAGEGSATILRVRETRLDGDRLARSAFHASALARV